MNQNQPNQFPNQGLPGNPGYGQNPTQGQPGGRNFPPQRPQGPAGPGFPGPNAPMQQRPGTLPGQAPRGKPQKPPKTKKPKKAGNGKWVGLGIFLFLLLIVGSGVLGYNSAISARKRAAMEQSIKAASQQFKMAMNDMDAGKYENAKVRLEWVLEVDPNYPGAAEKYMEVQVNLHPKETPTPFVTPTPAPTSTPDLRGEADMLNTARSQMAAQDWAGALQTMDALRDKNLEFEPLTVDGMYYIALRYLGISEVGTGYLEQGMYKITLAEAFGPIDYEASNVRLSGRNYLAGAGFWEIDWEKALNYYSQAYAANPFMYDRASGKTAQERYVQASYEYAYRMIAGQDPEVNRDPFCNAREYFNQALQISALEFVAQTATAVEIACNPPTSTPDASLIQPPPEQVVTDPNVAPTLPVAPPPVEPTLEVYLPEEPPVVPPTEPEAPPIEVPPTP